jgi:hypothetical protein
MGNFTGAMSRVKAGQKKVEKKVANLPADCTWVAGGKSSIDGVAGKSLNNLGVGFTFGYQINDNISLTGRLHGDRQ